jgi:hypothetical protein
LFLGGLAMLGIVQRRKHRRVQASGHAPAIGHDK